jgi:hypothetical protein
VTAFVTAPITLQWWQLTALLCGYVVFAKLADLLVADVRAWFRERARRKRLDRAAQLLSVECLSRGIDVCRIEVDGDAPADMTAEDAKKIVEGFERRYRAESDT